MLPALDMRFEIQSVIYSTNMHPLERTPPQTLILYALICAVSG